MTLSKDHAILYIFILCLYLFIFIIINDTLYNNYYLYINYASTNKTEITYNIKYKTQQKLQKLQKI